MEPENSEGRALLVGKTEGKLRDRKQGVKLVDVQGGWHCGYGWEELEL